MDGRGQALTFGEFAFDLAERRLTRGDREIDLGSRYFDALALLLAEPGTLVSKDRFMAEVWRGIPVTDEALTQCIRTLRRALGDDAAAPRFIATVPKHGYRFVAPVTVGPPAAAAAVPAGQRSDTARIAGAGAVGGLAAGVVGGLVYGLFSLAGGKAGGGTGALVLLALGGVLGLLGGAGVGLGMALARRWQPASPAALPIGGAAGGLAVGAVGSALGSDGIVLVTGAQVTQVTGLFEGAVLGLATGVAATLFARCRSFGAALAGAAVVGLGAGWLIDAAGGRLLGGSLIEVEQRIASSRLSLAAALGPWRDWLDPVEGAVFVLVLVGAQRIAARGAGTRKRRDDRASRLSQ